MKISIVTPSYNSVSYIRETIQSVLSQKGDFFIEYIIVDNCSEDGTRDIIEKFQSNLTKNNSPIGCKGVELIFISEQDSGMYDALNKGFSIATGEIFAWLNADDIYLSGALATIVKVFNQYADVHWVKGITSYITEEGAIWKAGDCLLYTQEWIKRGVYGRDHYFIQQDSVFWRAWLWKETGGIDASLKLAGDYYLWAKFAQHAPLITVRAWLSCFRTVKGQLSSDVSAYRQEVEMTLPLKNSIGIISKLFFRFEKRLPDFFKVPICKAIFGQADFSAILINSDGCMRRVKGAYYDVMRWL